MGLLCQGVPAVCGAPKTRSPFSSSLLKLSSSLPANLGRWSCHLSQAVKRFFRRHTSSVWPGTLSTCLSMRNPSGSQGNSSARASASVRNVGWSQTTKSHVCPQGRAASRTCLRWVPKKKSASRLSTNGEARANVYAATLHACLHDAPHRSGQASCSNRSAIAVHARSASACGTLTGCPACSKCPCAIVYSS